MVRISRHFAGYGASVGVFEKIFEAANKIAGEMRKGGGEAFVSGVDITDYQGVAKAIAQFEHQAGPTDVLVNDTRAGTVPATSSTPRPSSGTSSSPSTCMGR